MWNRQEIVAGKPLYLAVVAMIEKGIKAGLLSAGDRLPTHRALAKQLGINVSTVTRAFHEAEVRGIVTATTGSGTFVNSGLPFAKVRAGGVEVSQHIDLSQVRPLSGYEQDFKEVAQRFFVEQDVASLMSYAPPAGLLQHRQAGVGWVRSLGMPVALDNVIVCSGGQHALSCVFSGLFRPGSRVAVDRLTYPGLIPIARRYGIILEAVEMDEEGMLPEALDTMCKDYTIKGVFTSANFQNPTTARMSMPRKEAMVQVIKAHQLLLVELDPFSPFSLTDSKPLAALVPDQSVYVACLSQVLYAGLQVAFVSVPPAWYDTLVQTVFDTVVMAPPLDVALACECITSGVAAAIIMRKKKELKRRAALLAEVLGGYAPHYPAHGMFAWLTLPPGWSSVAFEYACNNAGVHLLAAARFAVEERDPPCCVRLSLSGAESREELSVGLERVAGVLERGCDGKSGV